MRVLRRKFFLLNNSGLGKTNTFFIYIINTLEKKLSSKKLALVTIPASINYQNNVKNIVKIRIQAP